MVWPIQSFFIDYIEHSANELQFEQPISWDSRQAPVREKKLISASLPLLTFTQQKVICEMDTHPKNQQKIIKLSLFPIDLIN